MSDDKDRKVHTINSGESNKPKSKLIVKDIPTVLGQIVNEYLIPIMENVFIDAVTNALNLTFFGDANNRKGPTLPFRLGGSSNIIPFPSNSQNSSQFSYDRIFKLSGPQTVDLRAAGFSFEKVRIASHDDATLALTLLEERIAQTGFARVSDLNNILGITGEWTDTNFGWTSLKSAGIVDIQDNLGGCRLTMPKAIPIEERYFK